MRGMHTQIIDIRRKVFTEVARLAYEGGDYRAKIDELPYKIVPGEIGKYRDSIFLERAITGERLRLAIGLPVRKMTEHAPLSQGIEASAIAEKYYEPPLINIIKFACNCCPEKLVKVTDTCQGCLAHPCQLVCPKNAIHIENGKSVIDQSACIKCGRCSNECPYNAIVVQERPCATACGMKAITSDEYGRAEINYDKCVSCGMCLVNCPFGAIADKGQIFQTIIALKSDVPVYAAVAPAFVGQFGPKVTPGKVKAALLALGFEDFIGVDVGADLCTIQEAQDFIDEVPESKKFLGTSCCPAWSVMAKKTFPQFAENISMALTPMVLTGRMIKKEHPNCKVAFIGPCAAKKLEASRKSVRSDIDFVLTFEEVMGMFEAKGIDLENIEEAPMTTNASGDGRGFAVSGGVANAVVNCIKQIAPDCDIKVESAQGLDNCKKMLMLAKAGRYDGYLLEGMACPGGCVAGAGTLQPVNKSTASVNKYKKEAKDEFSTSSEYKDLLPELE